jgi:hypothetical protein
MKLIRRIENLEESIERGGRRLPDPPVGCVWGMVWSGREEKLGRPLEPGETLAVDVYVEGPLIETIRVVWLARTVERASLDPLDAGVVYGVDGSAIGETLHSDGGPLLSIDAWQRGGPRSSGAH